MYGNMNYPFGFPMAQQPQQGPIFIPVYPQQPQPPFPQPPRGGKKNKSPKKKPSLKEMLQEAIDNRESLDAIIEKLQKKNDNKDDKKKDKGHLNYLEASGLMVITALPLALAILGAAKTVSVLLKNVIGM